MPAGPAADVEIPPVRAAIAAIEASDHDRASEIARAAIAQGTLHPLLLNLRAFWHEKHGRDREALSDLEYAHALAPADVTVLNALGLCLEKLGRPREALDALDKATRLAPDFVPGHVNAGRLREALGRSDEARTSYIRAMELGQNTHPNLAALAARRADWPTARMHAHQALAINPGLASAEHVLAAVEIAAGDHGAAAGRLSRVLQAASLPLADQATTLSLLADACDGAGNYAEAFAAYEAGNSALREIHAPRYANPTVETMRDYVERLSRRFERLPAEGWSPAGANPPGNEESPAAHVFIVGFARSGTTLLEEILACHPETVTTQERDGLADAVRDLLATEAGLDRLVALRGGGLARYRRNYWRRIAEFGLSARSGCLVDKQPYNTIGLPLIAKLFPGAKILFCVRDPRDVVLSCFRRRFAMNATNFQLLDLESAARFYDSVMRLAEFYRTKLALDIREVRYEALVSGFERETAGICDFIGLSGTGQMGNFAASAAGRAVVTPSGAQLAGGLNARGVGHWRNYRAQLEPVLPLLRPWIEKFGYPAD
ncbi:MAG TPA: sulfotransferase [Rhizomicrobium sp.]|jgi:tetratricopeptide (TPR) repeat protein|nr:sulfotransferase [Rhizomicrobium sp.]